MLVVHFYSWRINQLQKAHAFDKAHGLFPSLRSFGMQGDGRMDGFEPQKIEFVPIHIRKDRKHYIVEDITRQEYYEMPEICVEAIDLLQSGHTLEEIEGVLIKKYPDEIVDIQAFLAQLWELKLLKRWGDKVQEIHYVDKPSLSKGTVSTRLQAMGA